MSAKIAMSDTGSAAAVQEHHLLVDALARMAKVLVGQRRNIPAMLVEDEEVTL